MSVTPPSQGTGIVGFIKSIPSRISTMWNQRKVTMESGLSKLSSLFDKIRFSKTNAPPSYSGSGSADVGSISPTVSFDKTKENDEDYIINLAKDNPSLLFLAGDKLKNEPAFVAQALAIDPSYVYTREVENDSIPDEALLNEEVQDQFRENIEYQDGGYQNAKAERNLQFTPKDIASEHLEEFPEDFHLASSVVRGDAEIATSVLKTNPEQVEFVNWNNLTGREIDEVLKSNDELQNNPVYFQFAPEEWFDDNWKKVEMVLVSNTLSQKTLENLVSKMPNKWKFDAPRLTELAVQNETLAKVLKNSNLIS